MKTQITTTNIPSLSTLLALSIIWLQPSPLHAQAQHYYVDDGRKISEVQLRDLDPEQIEEWKIILYRPGEHYGSGWGSITGKTVESVMNQLKAAQEFDRDYARMFGGDPETEQLTSFNPSGPIAKLKRPTTRSKEVFALLGKLNSASNNLRDGYKKIKTLIATDFKGRNPVKDAGKTVKEYMDNFKSVQRNVAQIIQSAGDANKSAADMLSQIDKVNADINKTAALASALAGGNKNPLVGQWFYDTSYPDTRKANWIEFRADGTCVVKKAYDEPQILKWKVSGNEITIFNGERAEWNGTITDSKISWTREYSHSGTYSREANPR